MQDGKYTIYAIQFRWISKSPWLKPSEPLEPIKEKHSWSFVGPDSFAKAIDPHNNKSNALKFEFPESHEELRAVYSKTGYAGWFNLRFAIGAVKRLQKCSIEGDLDSFDTYGTHCQSIRYEFQIVKIMLEQKTECLLVQDVIDTI